MTNWTIGLRLRIWLTASLNSFIQVQWPIHSIRWAPQYEMNLKLPTEKFSWLFEHNISGEIIHGIFFFFCSILFRGVQFTKASTYCPIRFYNWKNLIDSLSYRILVENMTDCLFGVQLLHFWPSSVVHSSHHLDTGQASLKSEQHRHFGGNCPRTRKAKGSSRQKKRMSSAPLVPSLWTDCWTCIPSATTSPAMLEFGSGWCWSKTTTCRPCWVLPMSSASWRSCWGASWDEIWGLGRFFCPGIGTLRGDTGWNLPCILSGRCLGSEIL